MQAAYALLFSDSPKLLLLLIKGLGLRLVVGGCRKYFCQVSAQPKEGCPLPNLSHGTLSGLASRTNWASTPTCYTTGLYPTLSFFIPQNFSGYIIEPQSPPSPRQCSWWTKSHPGFAFPTSLVRKSLQKLIEEKCDCQVKHEAMKEFCNTLQLFSVSSILYVSI